MGDPQIEGAQEHRTGIFQAIDPTEVVPEAQGDGGQLQAAPAAGAEA